MTRVTPIKLFELTINIDLYASWRVGEPTTRGGKNLTREGTIKFAGIWIGGSNPGLQLGEMHVDYRSSFGSDLPFSIAIGISISLFGDYAAVN